MENYENLFKIVDLRDTSNQFKEKLLDYWLKFYNVDKSSVEEITLLVYGDYSGFSSDESYITLTDKTKIVLPDYFIENFLFSSFSKVSKVFYEFTALGFSLDEEHFEGYDRDNCTENFVINLTLIKLMNSSVHDLDLWTSIKDFMKNQNLHYNQNPHGIYYGIERKDSYVNQLLNKIFKSKNKEIILKALDIFSYEMVLEDVFSDSISSNRNDISAEEIELFCKLRDDNRFHRGSFHHKLKVLSI